MHDIPPRKHCVAGALTTTTLSSAAGVGGEVLFLRGADDVDSGTWSCGGRWHFGGLLVRGGGGSGSEGIVCEMPRLLLLPSSGGQLQPRDKASIEEVEGWKEERGEEDVEGCEEAFVGGGDLFEGVGGWCWDTGAGS